MTPVSLTIRVYERGPVTTTLGATPGGVPRTVKASCPAAAGGADFDRAATASAPTITSAAAPARMRTAGRRHTTTAAGSGETESSARENSAALAKRSAGDFASARITAVS